MFIDDIDIFINNLYYLAFKKFMIVFLKFSLSSGIFLSK